MHVAWTTYLESYYGYQHLVAIFSKLDLKQEYYQSSTN
jgi:hypothetical protein